MTRNICKSTVDYTDGEFIKCGDCGKAEFEAEIARLKAELAEAIRIKNNTNANYAELCEEQEALSQQLASLQHLLPNLHHAQTCESNHWVGPDSWKGCNCVVSKMRKGLSSTSLEQK